MPASIKKITRIQDTGIFSDFVPSSSCPEFHRFNLVYGFNGSGKTTLARVLDSLRRGDLGPHLDESSRFSIELNDGTTITESTNLAALSNQILVFNVDFIWENLRWKETSAEPVIYVGKAQKRDAERLEDFEKWIPERERTARETEKTLNAARRDFDSYKRDKARIISEDIAQGREYNARNLEQDVGRWQEEDLEALSEEKLSNLRALVRREAPKEKLSKLTLDFDAIALQLKTVERLLGESITASAIQELEKHPSMQSWVQTGLSYHSEHEIETCLFCDNPVGPERIGRLKEVFDTRFDQFSSELHAASDDISNITQLLTRLVVPSVNDVSDALADEYKPLRETFLTRAESLNNGIIKEALDALQRKATTPSTIFQLDGLSSGRELLTQLAKRQTELNELIERHNLKHDSFDADIRDARQAIRKHHVAVEKESYRSRLEDIEDKEHLNDSAFRKVRRARETAASLRERIRSHGPAVERINTLLSAYLGHSELALEANDRGYTFMRNGGAVGGPISEGEKSALALCYFLSKIEEEGKKASDWIIVIDDPVSSMDTKALNYAFNLIKACVKGAGQVFILTHNMPFMNEVKKWLRNRSHPRDRSKEPTASLLQIKVLSKNYDADRRAELRELSKLLRLYDSEYHYLFYLTHRFANSEKDEEHEYLYLMPNALRKVLEAFLMFKVPTDAALVNKLEDSEVRQAFGDENAAKAVERLLQVESHGDSLDDFASHCPMTIEETLDAAVAIMSLMQRMDEAHFKALERQVSS